jgi:3-hydroxyisobutyrate dehydrogenase-like beta-hydroxyacid dehydrogenase
MGLGVARSLLRTGFRVHACDLRSAVLENFAGEGGVACSTPAELGAQCEVVITLVVNAAQTDTVLFGDEGAVANMKPGSVVIASARSPRTSRSNSAGASRRPVCKCSMHPCRAARRAPRPVR